MTVADVCLFIWVAYTATDLENIQYVLLQYNPQPLAWHYSGMT